jgi:23S rRNA pseudouridine1911/1915/1917 synthase
MKAPVPADLDGERADLVVARLAGIARAPARRLVEEGAALVDGVAVAPSSRLAAGAVVEVEVPEPGPLLVPEDVPFAVRYEDGDVAVVDKPAGVVVHPGAGRAGGTLAAGLLRRWPSLEGVGQPDRWGIVHRLDRDTSGLLVVGLTAASHAALQQAVKDRAVERSYLALVHGRPPAATGTIDAALDRDPSRTGRFVVSRTGREARTHYRRVASWAEVSLLDVRLETGRTHQIRVHLASVGMPVAGDPLYGRPGGPSPRLFLHATRLAFVHPVTGDRIEVESPLPDDLAGVVVELGRAD